MPAISIEKEFLRGVPSDRLKDCVSAGYTLATLLQIGQERIARRGITPEELFPVQMFDLIDHNQQGHPEPV